MVSEIIQSRLAEYKFESSEDEWNVIREIVQELALAALSQAGLFKFAAFQGGTCLRILYGLSRFSEDLDFVLLQENRNFKWENYAASLAKEFQAFGLDVQIQDRSKVGSSIKTAFIKRDSVGQVLTFQFPRARSQSQTIRIKLEVDSRPPAGAVHETKMINFPYPCAVTVHDLSSLFAGKCHALLCRTYTKGRDYYDLLWYLRKKTPVNLVLLQNALEQTGPWRQTEVRIDQGWLVENLQSVIKKTDFSQAVADVRKFLGPIEARGLEAWGQEYFLEQVAKLNSAYSEAPK